MKVKSESEVAQSCPTLSDPMDCSPPGSSAHGIFQARVLEWGAIAFSSISLPVAYWARSGHVAYAGTIRFLFLRICVWYLEASSQFVNWAGNVSCKITRRGYHVDGETEWRMNITDFQGRQEWPRMRVLGAGGVPNVSVSLLSPWDPPCSRPWCHVLKSSLLSISLKNSFWNLKVEPILMHMVLATLKSIFFIFSFLY